MTRFNIHFQMLRQRISSDIQSMEELHRRFPWIPGGESIRPNPTIIENKKNYISNMLNRYEAMQDFVLHRIFGLKNEVKGDWANSKLFVSDAQISAARAAVCARGDRHEYRFIPNLFSYAVPDGTKHYVIWFLLNENETHSLTGGLPLTDEEINTSIENALGQLLGPDKTQFSFVWYPNPKPTIVSSVLFHVQVFWIA